MPPAGDPGLKGGRVAWTRSLRSSRGQIADSGIVRINRACVELPLGAGQTGGSKRLAEHSTGQRLPSGGGRSVCCCPNRVTVAQPVERSLETRGVAGSTPAGHVSGCGGAGHPTGFGSRGSQVRVLPARLARWRSGCPREPHELETVGSNPARATSNGDVAQTVRPLACQARGRRFEPGRSRVAVV